ncbi:MAG TPA: phosphorylase [Terriglobales bacterium]|nr:phosphorylase [Terriglobales bacterium]
MSDSCKVAVIAALEREVWPFVKNWPTVRHSYDNRDFKFFESEGTVVVCGGIGADAARRAAQAVIEIYRPVVLISAGFAGALNPELEVGHTFTARQVINALDGSRSDSGSGEGVLISFSDIADVEQKARLGEAYGADAVDMEAAAVARSAEAHGVKFLACKVISDKSRTALLPITQFVGNNGKFHVLQFVSYIAVRPWLWGKVRKLASDSAVAASKLCIALAETSQSHANEQVVTK